MKSFEQRIAELLSNGETDRIKYVPDTNNSHRIKEILDQFKRQGSGELIVGIAEDNSITGFTPEEALTIKTSLDSDSFIGDHFHHVEIGSVNQKRIVYALYDVLT